MNGESKPTLRPLLFVILFGVLVTSVVTAFRSGFLQVFVRWPDDQPSAPLLVALLGVALALLTVYLIVSGRRASGRPSEPPMSTGAGPPPPHPRPPRARRPGARAPADALHRCRGCRRGEGGARRDRRVPA